MTRPGASAIVARLKPPATVERDIARKLSRTYVGWLRAEFLRALREVGMPSTDADEPGRSPRALALEALQRVRVRLRTNPPREPDLSRDGAVIVERANKAAIAATRWVGGELPAVPVLTSELTALRVAAWTQEASKPIVSLPSEAIDRLERIMVQKYTDGSRVETIARAFEEQLGITGRHVMMIARDQTAKLNAKTIKQDFESAGIDGYVWTTADDERVREDHAVLDGTLQSWGDPPIADQRTQERGHPGEVFQCRCVALPAQVRQGRSRA